MADMLVLIEDKNTRRQLTELLRGDQFQVIATGDAEMARALMRNASFDVVVADVKMKGQNGIEIIAQVHHALPQAEVIAISASAMGRSAFYKSFVDTLNVSHYFTLPFENVAVLRAARNLVSAQRKRHVTVAAVAVERQVADEEERQAVAAAF